MNARTTLVACLTVFATAGLAAQHAPSLADLEARARADSNDPLLILHSPRLGSRRSRAIPRASATVSTWR
jgi:hypothetical protein